MTSVLRPLVIRPYQDADHDAVVQLYLDGMASYSFSSEDKASRKLWEQVRKESVEGDLADIEGYYRARGGQFWVAVVPIDGDKEGVVGMVALQSQSGYVGILRRMSVRKSFRRQGLGRKLVIHLENWARVNGFKRVELTTGMSMTRAVEFYKAAGYTLSHTSLFSQEPRHETAHFAKSI